MVKLKVIWISEKGFQKVQKIQQVYYICIHRKPGTRLSLKSLNVTEKFRLTTILWKTSKKLQPGLQTYYNTFTVHYWEKNRFCSKKTWICLELLCNSHVFTTYYSRNYNVFRGVQIVIPPDFSRTFHGKLQHTSVCETGPRSIFLA